MKVAVLGLGIIGSRAAAKLRESAHEVTTWNRTPKPGVAAEIADAVRDAEVVSLYLKDAPAVRDVAARVFEHAEGAPALLNHSTVDLDTTRWLAGACAERGWTFLDAPFTGSRDAAGGGSLVYYVGGRGDDIDAFREFLLLTGREVVPCGETGAATIIKLTTNLISACTVQALSEALATGRRHGVDPDVLIDAVNSNACGSPLAAMKLPNMAAGDFDTHFSLENMLKDSRYALALAEGLDTPAIRAVSERMAELCERGLGDLDYSALASPYSES